MPGAPVRCPFSEATMRVRPILLLLALVWCTWQLAPAGTTGKIAGKVTDAQTGEALVGVNVVLAGSALGASTNIDGEYFILNIPPGTYQVRASAVGYSPVTVNSVKVNVDQTTRVPFTLSSQTVEISDVVVTANRPIVQKDLTSTTSSVSGDELKKLPLEDVAAVVNLQAGVVEGHFRGGRSGEVKYMVDGVSVNDMFNGNFSVQAEVNSIEEVQVLSGTFNAEYGEALSGVVNQVTKIAGEDYSGELSAYTGDYVSGRKSLYRHIDHISPSDLYNFQGSLSGPVPGTNKILKFFLSGRYYYNAGYLYGQRVFNTHDSSNFSANSSSDWYVGATGDKAYVPMNSQEHISLQGKLNVNVGGASSRGIVLSFLYQRQNYRDYDFMYQLDPDGDYKKFQTGYLGSASYTHMFNDATFIDVLGSVFVSDYKQYVFEDPYDARYAKVERLSDVGSYAFYTGGTENWHFYHRTNTYTGKIDLTSQINPVHQIKTGVEFDRHTLSYTDYQILLLASNGYQPSLPEPGAFDYTIFKNHPTQFAGYVQDKIELDYLVVNVGVRFDYFQPDGRRLKDPDNIAELDDLTPPYPDSLTVKATAKYQFSPRIGISYPISDRGAVHFSYGHFFQIPSFEYLYKNPNYRIPLSSEYPGGNIIGNPDLEPQRTTMYEIGLQQELTPTIGVTLTGYYKDIRNLLGMEIHEKSNYKKFGEYVNLDYGAVRGFTISFEKRMSGGFGATMDYTFQVASGNASDPYEDYSKSQESPPIESNKELVPLDWDRRHSLNVTVTLGNPDNLVVSAIGRLGSGLPYTPSAYNERTGLENSANKPLYRNVDIYVTKSLRVFGLNSSVFLKIYNVFDIANEIDVYTDTGRAGYTLELTQAASTVVRGVNTLAEYYSRPDYYSAPRQVILGATVDF